MTRFFLIPILMIAYTIHARETRDVAPGDTLNYTLRSHKPTWVYVHANDANLALALYLEGEKIWEQDDSKGMNAVERWHHVPQNGGKYELKVWAKSYVGQSKNARVEIEESAICKTLNGKYNTAAFQEDLKVFRAIREEANSGLYVYRSPAEIDSIYHWAGQAVLTCKNILDFYKIIATLTQFEGSCHNFTELPNHASYYLTTKDEYLPITLKNIEGRLLQNSKEVSVPLSAEILSINEIPAREIIRRLSGYYASDGYILSYREVAGFEKGMLDKFFIEFGTHRTYNISYKWNDQIHQVTLPGISFEKFKELQENRHSLTFDKKLRSEKYALDKVNDSLYRLSIQTFDFALGKEDPAYEKFGHFLDSMILTLDREKIGHLIIDLRGNTGGTGALYEKAFSYFTRQPFRDSHYAYTKFNEVPLKDRLVISPLLLANQVADGYGLDSYLKQTYPIGIQGKFYWANEKNPLILPNEHIFKGQIYLFVDEYVASAGSHMASLIKSYTNAIIIGKETDGGYYEHNGHLPLVYELPNTGIQTGFSIVHVIQDAQILPDQSKGSGIIPDIKVHQTDEDFLKHTDAFLRKAIELQAESAGAK